MKLKSSLRDLSLEELREVLTFWELPEPAPEAADEETDAPRLDARGWRAHLYPRLQSQSHFDQAFAKLDSEERDLVSFLAVHGGFMESKELQRRLFPKRRDEMKEVLDRLRLRGFVFSQAWKDAPGKPLVYGLPEPYLRLIDLPHFWRGYLGRLLRDIPADRLCAIAANGLHLRRTQGKRDLLVHEIRGALTDPERLRAYVDAMPEEQREILFLILQRRGVVLYRDLVSQLQRRRPEIVRSDALDRLIASSGLLFASDPDTPKHQSLLRVPRDLYYMITHHFVADDRGLRELDAINQVDPEQQPRTILDNGIAILRDIVILVGYVERHAVRRLGNGGIGKNDLKKILTRLSAHKTLKYAQFLAFYAIRRGFLVPTNGHWSISDSFRERLNDSRAFYVDLYATWRQTTEWNEEFVEGDCLHTDNYPGNLINISELRKLVLQNLAEIPFDTWIDGPRFIESLLVQIEAQIPHRSGKAHLDKQNRINYLVIESVLCESLYWLGIVSLGLPENATFEELGNRREVEKTGEGNGSHARQDRHFNFNPRPLLPDAYHFLFQINGLGRSILSTGLDTPREALLRNDDVALPFRDDMFQFTVLPNLDVVAPPDLNLGHFFRLRQFAEIRHIDVMSIMAITRNSVRAAMDHGIGAEDILEFLEENAPSGLPETVRHLVNECNTRYGEIAMGYAGGYIRVNDVVRLEDLRKNKALAAQIKDIVDNRVVLLQRDADVPQIARELKKMGLMPALDNQNVYKTSEGRLRISLTEGDFATLLSALRFVVRVEELMETEISEGKVRSLMHAIEPTSKGHLNVRDACEMLSQRFVKQFQQTHEKQIEGVAKKYRNQMRQFLSHHQDSAQREAYEGANPATRRSDIRKMIHFAIDHETSIELKYLNTTKEELVESVRPESINGDRVHAFCEARQAYCAYRLSRVQAAEIK